MTDKLKDRLEGHNNRLADEVIRTHGFGYPTLKDSIMADLPEFTDATKKTKLELTTEVPTVYYDAFVGIISETSQGKAVGGKTYLEKMIVAADDGDKGNQNDKTETSELLTAIEAVFQAYADKVLANKDAINAGLSPEGMPCQVNVVTSGCAEGSQCATVEVKVAEGAEATASTAKATETATEDKDPMVALKEMNSFIIGISVLKNAQIDVCVLIANCGTDTDSSGQNTFLCGAINLGAAILTGASIILSM